MKTRIREILQVFVKDGTISVGDSVQKLIRSVLECGLRTKYCSRLEGHRMLSELLVRLYRDLKLLKPEVAQELQELNKMSQACLHAVADQAPVHSLTTSELQRLAEKTLNVLEKI